ncbi:MAG: cytochrome P450 [Candidatus Dormiibacterota bacterium]
MAAPTAVRTIDNIDIYDPEVYVEDVPHDQFAILRREAPVYHHYEPGTDGFWAVTRYPDVVAVSRDSATFSSHRGSALMNDIGSDELANLQLMMLNMDPPKHTRMRLLVNKGFTPQMIQRLKDRVGELCTEIVDGVAQKGQCDFVTEIAAELPLQVIAEMVGIPVEDRHKIFDWSNKLIGFDDPEFQNTPEIAQEVSMQMYMYANELAEQRKDSPREDLVSVLMRAEVDGETLTEMEFDLFFLLLAVAGNETTRNLISGGMRAMFEHPDQWQALVKEPELLNPAVEEMLRWVTPVMQFRRTTTRDVELHGVPMKEGDKVIIYYSSANRDEEYFDSPQSFNVRRDPNEHLTFGGGGAHFCLGANLARLEIRLIFEELRKRLPDIELAAPPRRLRSNFINGVKEMQVRYTPEGA